MATLSQGARHLRQGIGVRRHAVPNSANASRTIHIPTSTPRPSPPSTTQRIYSASRTFFSRIVSHLVATPASFSAPTPIPSIRPAHLSNTQSINARFSLPVKHALSRPFSAPRLPKPPVVPANVSQVGLGTARAFHSGRPIFQNMIDNVPIATRALWEVEWEVKLKKKEERRIRRAAQHKEALRTKEMLKPKPSPIINEPSELDVYFPVEHTPAVTTHLLVPLAPTPTARLPLNARFGDDSVHPLLPISDLASIHTGHRLHSLRVSTLFAKLDSANVWHDPGVNVDAYAFGTRGDTQEKQCTVLRVTFRGWNHHRVRAILGDNVEEWYSLEETRLDGVPTPDTTQDAHLGTRHHSQSLGSTSVHESMTDDGCDVPVPLPMRASASEEHEFVIPTLDLSCSFTDTVDHVPSPPRPVIFLRTVSELMHDGETLSVSRTPSLPPDNSSLESSWESLPLSSSFLQHVDEHHREEDFLDM